MIKECLAAVLAGSIAILMLLGSSSLAQNEQAQSVARTAANERGVAALEKQVAKLETDVKALQPKAATHHEDYTHEWNTVGTKCTEWFWMHGEKQPVPKGARLCAE